MKNQSCFTEFIRYTFANVAGMLGLSCYILADTFFVSKALGSNGLAALNLAIPVYNFIHGCGLMTGIGSATRYSICKSQHREKEGNAAFTHAILLTGFFAVFFLLIGLFFSDTITMLLGADSSIFQMCKTYLRMLLLFSPAFLLNDVFLCFIRNDGAPKLAMYAMLGGSFSNIILDYVFMFPLKLGIFGAVFATGLAPIISLLIQSRFLFKKQNHFHLRKCRLLPGLFGKIFISGLPSLVTELSSGIVMIVFNTIILGLQGNYGVAAYGVVANLSLVVIAIYTGISQGIQPLISRDYGLNNLSCIQKTLKYALSLVALLSAAIYGFVFFGADAITLIFNSERNATLQAIAVYGLRIYFTGCIFAGLNIVLATYFTSTDNAKPANIISLLRGFILIVPFALLFSLLFNITGLWCSFPATELLTACVAILFLGIRRKQNVKVTSCSN